MSEKTDRRMIATRIGARGVEWMDQIALEETGIAPGNIRVGRSDVIRASLLVARRHEKELRAFLRGNYS